MNIQLECGYEYTTRVCGMLECDYEYTTRVCGIWEYIA